MLCDLCGEIIIRCCIYEVVYLERRLHSLYAMLKNYLIISVKVLLRRKFYTFISLVGISFALMVLMVLSALY